MIIHSALLHHNDTGQWLSFREPVAVLATRDRRRVVSLMREVEARVEAESLTAVGFVGLDQNAACGQLRRQVRETAAS